MSEEDKVVMVVGEEKQENFFWEKVRFFPFGNLTKLENLTKGSKVEQEGRGTWEVVSNKKVDAFLVKLLPKEKVIEIRHGQLPRKDELMLYAKDKYLGSNCKILDFKMAFHQPAFVNVNLVVSLLITKEETFVLFPYKMYKMVSQMASHADTEHNLFLLNVLQKAAENLLELVTENLNSSSFKL